jgi:hypothetical protein
MHRRQDAATDGVIPEDPAAVRGRVERLLLDLFS